MPLPNFSEIGGWVYNESLLPAAEPYDAARGYPLAWLADGLGRQLQPVYDLVKDPSILVDPDRAPRGWLPWLSQFVDARIPESGLSTQAEEIARIKDPPRRRRGTVPAMVELLQQYLLTSKTVIVTERVGGNAWRGTLAVFNAELKAGVTIAQLQALINTEQKPAGMIITVTGVTPTTYNALRDTHTDYNDVRSTFVTYDEVEQNPTKQ